MSQMGQMAVLLNGDEWDRVLYWLHKPVPPGPAKDMDVSIIRKINGTHEALRTLAGPAKEGSQE